MEINSQDFYTYDSETGTTENKGHLLNEATVVDGGGGNSSSGPKQKAGIPQYSQGSEEYFPMPDADHKEDGIDMSDFELTDYVQDWIDENITVPVLEWVDGWGKNQSENAPTPSPPASPSSSTSGLPMPEISQPATATEIDSSDINYVGPDGRENLLRRYRSKETQEFQVDSAKWIKH